MTVRSHIYIVNKLMVALLLSLPWLAQSGCTHSNKTPSPNGSAEKGLRLMKLDVAKRGKTDTWRWLKKNKEGVDIVVREEIDLNGDNKVDFKKYYEAGDLLKVAMDLDFDGKVDLTEHYETGKLAHSEASYRFDGKPDTWRYYEADKLVRIERDTNRDGKPDEWMYYEDGRLKRTARDFNFDSVVDTWEE